MRKDRIMKNNRILRRLMTFLMIVSIIFESFPISTFAKDVDYKIESISDYQTDKEIIEAKKDEDNSSDDQLIVDVTIKKETRSMTLVYQKGLELTDNSLIPDDMEIDKDYEDDGSFGKSYTSLKLKRKNQNSTNKELENLNEEKIENKLDKNLKDTSLEDKDNEKDEKETITFAFDIKKKDLKGEIFAAISDQTVSVIGNEEERSIVEKDQKQREGLRNTEETDENHKDIAQIESKALKDGEIKTGSKESKNRAEAQNDKEKADLEKTEDKDGQEEDPETEQMSSFMRSNNTKPYNEFKGEFFLKKLDEEGNPLGGAKFNLTYENGSVERTIDSTNHPDGIRITNISEGTYFLKEVEAPEGYELQDDYYRIDVNKYGFTVVTYVKAENSSERAAEPRTVSSNPPALEPIRASKTEGVVDVLDYSLEPIVNRSLEQGLPSIHFTSGDFIRMKMTLKVKDDARAGDSFTIKLDEKLSPTGLRERYIPPVALMARGQVVATGRYDADNHSFVYTFTDYVERHNNVTVSVTYNTFGPETKKVLDSGAYSFTNTIDGNIQPEKRLYINYGKSFEFNSVLNKGRKMRNNVASIDRHGQVVERIIYLNQGIDEEIKSTAAKQYWELINYGDSTVFDIEVYRVYNDQKDYYMADSTHGDVSGLETQRLRPQIQRDDKNKKYRIVIESYFYNDRDGRKLNSGILIKVKERLSSFRGGSDMTAKWGYVGWNNYVGMRSSILDSKASSDGNSEKRVPVIPVRNKKIPKTSIKVSKKWYAPDGKDKEMPDARISYKLMQVGTTSDGTKTSRVYKEDTLSAKDSWTKTHDNLPFKGKNDRGEEVSYTYYVAEDHFEKYKTSYHSGEKESEKPEDLAISKGEITIKNTEEMKFVLPDTGGSGRRGLYIGGSLLVILGIIIIIKRQKA